MKQLLHYLAYPWNTTVDKVLITISIVCIIVVKWCLPHKKIENYFKSVNEKYRENQWKEAVEYICGVFGGLIFWCLVHTFIFVKYF